jgi:hypothetical protein
LKDKIERLANGIFEYELPEIMISESEIQFSVETGKSYEGSLSIRNSNQTAMKGVLSSSSRYFVLDRQSFYGTENTITYRFEAKNISAGEQITGQIILITDCGEAVIPYTIQVEEAYFLTSLGKIKDLFQFTNLARGDWEEAKKIFQSEDFDRIILKKDPKFSSIYNNLRKSSSINHAMEEFLIAIRKKSKITFSTDKSNPIYVVEQDSFLDKLTITKNQWGYAQIFISTDAPFIQLEEKTLSTDQFAGNSYSISYIIDPKCMRNGTNYGRITIKTCYQTIAVTIVCKKERSDEEGLKERKKEQLFIYHITNNYLNFRTNQINLVDYIYETDALLNEFISLETKVFYQLYEIHHAIISGEETRGKELIDRLKNDGSDKKKDSVIEHSAFLYLQAMLNKDELTVRQSAEKLRNYYENGHSDWRILWFLLYTDARYEDNGTLKLRDMKEQYEAGCRSPILYYEAISLINEEPYLLRELSQFETQVMYYAIKNRLLTKEVVLQYIYLANKKKRFHRIIFHCLVMLYEDNEDKDLLSIICSTLIKGLKKDPKYFIWYQLGVEAQLRITELYEYYMYSIPEEENQTIAAPVLLYFIYNSNLNDKKKAYLYAEIIKHKSTNEAMFRTYYKRMEIFALKQLEAHHIDLNLAVLYNEFFEKIKVTDQIARLLPYVMFRNEFLCNHPGMKGVIVIHKEQEREEYYPLLEGKVQIDLYSNNAELYLVDLNSNRYITSVEYSLQQLFEGEEYCSVCEGYSDHPLFLIHLLEKYDTYQMVHEQAVELRKNVLQLENLSEQNRILCLQNLIEYYYENYDGEQLDYYLQRIDVYKVSAIDRIRLLEYLIVRDMYDKAQQMMRDFGYQGVSTGKLVKLCSKLITKTKPEEKDQFLIELCCYVYTEHKYDEAILSYLVRHYDGSTRDMIVLWQVAKNFEIGTSELEERLLAQMLFAESNIQDSFQVFNEYYKSVTNHLLVKAYLTYYAFKYVVKDRIVPDELFQIMKRELNYEENDICMLAYLKYNAGRDDLPQNELTMIEYQLNHFCQRGIILPFYMEYKKKVKLPEQITNQFYVEYKTDPSKKVFIHYRLVNKKESSFITEPMANVFMGIHVKEFFLFYHELLQYYISEEQEEEAMITESLHVHYDKEELEEDETKYHQINLMLMAKEMHDDATLVELMEHYIRKEYIISQCFQPLHK